MRVCIRDCMRVWSVAVSKSFMSTYFEIGKGVFGEGVWG